MIYFSLPQMNLMEGILVEAKVILAQMHQTDLEVPISLIDLIDPTKPATFPPVTFPAVTFPAVTCIIASWPKKYSIKENKIHHLTSSLTQYILPEKLVTKLEFTVSDDVEIIHYIIPLKNIVCDYIKTDKVFINVISEVKLEFFWPEECAIPVSKTDEVLAKLTGHIVDKIT